ncbi:uncharacterized protein [Dermacentor albipictus]|uniref:uncharacterized protein isoform X1 n=2 Tax=Dermacentor albipictus TaxID=60249 RepID=UPI0038FC0AE0
MNPYQLAQLSVVLSFISSTLSPFPCSPTYLHNPASLASLIAICMFRARSMSWFSRNRVVPLEVQMMCGFLQPSTGHARRIGAILTAESWRQVRFYQECLRVRCAALGDGHLWNRPYNDWNKLAMQHADFLWRMKLPELQQSKRKHLSNNSPENNVLVLGDAIAMAAFPNIAMAYTSSDDAEFQCLTSTLTYLNEETKEGTYVWYFKSPVDHHTVIKESTFEISPGETQDQVHFLLDNDQCDLYTAYFNYTDYENCVVTIIPYYGDNLCILWVAMDTVDKIPESCLGAYHETCPIEYRAYDSDICEK